MATTRAETPSAPIVRAPSGVPTSPGAMAPQPGDLYMWGRCVPLAPTNWDATDYELSVTTQLRPQVMGGTDSLDVCSVACGDRHGMLKVRGGEVYTWGEGARGVLGHGMKLDAGLPQRMDPICDGTNVTQLSCGSWHSAALLSDGSLYTWGDQSGCTGLLGYEDTQVQWRPRRLRIPGASVRVVACGRWHTAAVTHAGQLYTWGEGLFGALGHGSCDRQFTPRLVEALDGMTVLHAACGLSHSAAVVGASGGSSGSGQLYTWGDGDVGQLGFSTQSKVLLPQKVTGELTDASVCMVACGAGHTVALTTRGQVYEGGKGAGGKNVGYMGRVKGALENVVVNHIACGDVHTAAVGRDWRYVYTWGKGEHGQLGHGDLEDVAEPKSVVQLHDRQVMHLDCGPESTSAVCVHANLSTETRVAMARDKVAVEMWEINVEQLFGSDTSPSPTSTNAAARARRLSFATDSSGGLTGTTSDVSSQLALIQRDQSGKQGKMDWLVSRWLKRVARIKSTKSTTSRSQSSKSAGSSSVKRTDITNDFSKENAQLKVRVQSLMATQLELEAELEKVRARARDDDVTTLALKSANAERDAARAAAAQALLDEKEAAAAAAQGIARAAKTRERAIAVVAQQEVAALRARVGELEAKLGMAPSLPEVSALDAEVCRLESVEVPDGMDVGPASPARDTSGAAGYRSPSGGSPSTPVPEPRVSALRQASSMKNVHPWARPVEDEGPVLAGAVPPAHPPAVAAPPPTPSVPMTPVAAVRVVDPHKPHPNSAGPDEWVEEVTPGVFITIVRTEGGTNELKRVRFSRRKYDDVEAQRWWEDNRYGVLEEYGLTLRGGARMP